MPISRVQGAALLKVYQKKISRGRHRRPRRQHRAILALTAVLATILTALAITQPASGVTDPCDSCVAWAWGSNNSGQLGDGTVTTAATPVQVSNFNDVAEVAAGGGYTLALKRDGTVWAWGSNASGQLGNGSTTSSLVPVQVAGLANITAVAAGSNHALALRNDGVLFAWGGNFHGQLGIGTFSNLPTSTPVKVSALSGVTAIAADGGYSGGSSVAVRNDGTVWAWGDYTIGDSVNVLSPLQVSSLTNAIAVTTHSGHTLALASDGTVWGWGTNEYDQLGNGTRTTATEPVKVNTFTGVTQVSTGNAHSLAVSAGGTVWAWGWQYTSGQNPIGGIEIISASPVTVTGVTAAEVSAGNAHSLALGTDGTVWAWGSNFNRQLGNGTNVDSQTTPIQVSSLAGMTSVSAGYVDSFAVRGATVPEPTPTPTPPPTDPLAVKSVDITASASDRLLTRTIKVAPTDPSLVARYEYSWASTPTGNTKGATVQRCSITVALCRLNYRPTNPDTDWNLLARVVATDGTKGPWFIKQIHTPKAPILVVFGDSVSSGHHRDSEGAPTICTDETYSYGQTVWNGLLSQLPAQWQLEHGYVNEAHSGFSTANVMFGGVDACGDDYVAELPRIVKRLKENAGSWNRVVGTAGINDTNWGDVIGSIVKESFLGRISTTVQCKALVGQWNLFTQPTLRQQVVANVQSITAQIASADPLARDVWVSYYNIAGTGTGLYQAPTVCQAPLANALSTIHASLKSALSGTFSWVNDNPVIGNHDELLQDFYNSDVVFKTSGWPHPNRDGAARIGSKILGNG